MKDGVDVDIINVISVLSGECQSKLNENIDTMYEEAQDKLSEYKEYFRESIHELYRKIKEVLDKMDKDTADFERLKETVKEEKEKAAFAEKKIDELMNVINFKA